MAPLNPHPHVNVSVAGRAATGGAERGSRVLFWPGGVPPANSQWYNGGMNIEDLMKLDGWISKDGMVPWKDDEDRSRHLIWVMDQAIELGWWEGPIPTWSKDLT